MIAAEKLPVQVACRVLDVSESGFYEHRDRAPSERAVRHAMLTDLIRQVHCKSKGTYGIQRVHAVLTLGRGVRVTTGGRAHSPRFGRPLDARVGVHDSLHQAGLAFRHDDNTDVVVFVKPGADKRDFDASLLGDIAIGNAARIDVRTGGSDLRHLSRAVLGRVPHRLHSRPDGLPDGGIHLLHHPNLAGGCDSGRGGDLLPREPR